jgi:hypothetical protein
LAATSSISCTGRCHRSAATRAEGSGSRNRARPTADHG